jgi:hypothetical protein
VYIWAEPGKYCQWLAISTLLPVRCAIITLIIMIRLLGITSFPIILLIITTTPCPPRIQASATAPHPLPLLTRPPHPPIGTPHAELPWTEPHWSAVFNVTETPKDAPPPPGQVRDCDPTIYKGLGRDCLLRLGELLHDVVG